MNDFYILLIVLFFSFSLSFIICLIQVNLKKRIPDDRIELKKLYTSPKRFTTFGGIGIIISLIITYLIFCNNIISKTSLSLLFALIYYFIIGLIDDVIKVCDKNSKGLSGYIRILFEFIGVLIIINIIGFNRFLFIKEIFLNKTIYIGFFSILYVSVCLIGFSNAINISDGLDGLITGLLICAITPFLFISFKNNNADMAYFIMAYIGSLLGYLCFNFNPSRLIMGDCGSLPLGVCFALTGILLNHELLLLISGAVFVINLLSVILQVSYFKLTKGKRIFKMSPLHYHFIKCGMNESNVVLLYWIFAIILSLIAILVGVML